MSVRCRHSPCDAADRDQNYSNTWKRERREKQLFCWLQKLIFAAQSTFILLRKSRSECRRVKFSSRKFIRHKPRCYSFVHRMSALNPTKSQRMIFACALMSRIREPKTKTKRTKEKKFSISAANLSVLPHKIYLEIISFTGRADKRYKQAGV